MAAQSVWPSWLMLVTHEDLTLNGVEVLPGQAPLAAVLSLAEDLGVGVAQVEPCLKLLQGERCMLLGGSPLALLSYSHRRRRFCASFDGYLEAGMDQLSDSGAGVWLLQLAGEIGALPTRCDHWLIARLEEGQLRSPNEYARGLARRYVEQVLRDGSAPDDDLNHEWLMGRAIWRCAAHLLR